MCSIEQARRIGALEDAKRDRAWHVMTPRGYNDGDVIAASVEQAIEIVEQQRGFEVLDVMDDVIVIADE
ncbi:MAG TPA: hypothetical protein VFF43_18130 [Caldimonas sp.]|nr:hypothetical protein [Caldimonas sp.]